MRKNRELRQKNSTLWDTELKKHLDHILQNIQRDYILKSAHQAMLDRQAAAQLEQHQHLQRQIRLL